MNNQLGLLAVQLGLLSVTEHGLGHSCVSEIEFWARKNQLGLLAVVRTWALVTLAWLEIELWARGSWLGCCLLVLMSVTSVGWEVQSIT